MKLIKSDIKIINLIKLLLISILYISCSFTYPQTEIDGLEKPIIDYGSPFIEGTIVNLNSGWIKKSPKPKLSGLDIEFNIIATGTFFGESDRHFSSNANVKFSESTIDRIIRNVPDHLKQAVKDTLLSTHLNVSVSGPTVVGPSDESIMINYPGDTITVSYNGQNHNVVLNPVSEDSKITGLGFPIVPLAAVQFSIGTLAGSSFSFRMVPPIYLGSNLGSIFYFGGQLQHNPMVWFMKKPVIDVSVGLMMYHLNVGKFFKSFGVQPGISVSKSFGISVIEFSPFIGVSFGYSKTNLNYSYKYFTETGERKSVDFIVELEREVKPIFNTGFEFRAAVFNLSLNYAFSRYHNFSAGIGIKF